MNPTAELDRQARVMQMQVNSRQFAATMALELMKCPGYAKDVDHLTLIAMATDIEQYVMGKVEEQTKAALEAAASKFGSPKIVRP